MLMAMTPPGASLECSGAFDYFLMDAQTELPCLHCLLRYKLKRDHSRLNHTTATDSPTSISNQRSPSAATTTRHNAGASASFPKNSCSCGG